MNILLTGATGFIGGKTKLAFEKEGFTAKAFKGDITNFSDWHNNLAGGEVLLLIAGIRTETDHDFVVNAESINTLFTTAVRDNKLPKRVILASSQAVYMGNKPPFKEVDKPIPTTIYGKSKLEGEKITQTWCQKLNIPLVIFRYSTVLGAGVREKSKMSGPLFFWTKAAEANEPIKVYQDGNQTRDYIHVNDVATANITALNLLPGTYNVGGGKPIKVIDLARWVKEATRSESDIEIVGGEATETDPRVMQSDISKIESLGWSPNNNPKQAVVDFFTSLKLK